MRPGWRRAPHPRKRLMAEPEMREAALRIRRTNILRPFVDDDMRLLSPLKLAMEWGFRVEPHMAVMCLLVRRLGREYVWKVHVSSDKGQKFLLHNLERVHRAVGLFLREEELVQQIDADWATRGNQVIMIFPFVPDPKLEGFTEAASGKSNTALAAYSDGKPLLETI